MTDWPCHVWLQKKIVLPTNKAALGVCYRFLCTNLGDGILCTLWPNHNIHEVNGVYQQWTQYALKSKSVVEMHFPGIWRSKFTDFASKKLNLWEKTAVDKSAWIKDWTYLSKSLRISILPINFRLALPHSESYFFFLCQSPSLSLCTVFDVISSNTDEFYAINPSANVFVFGDFNAHHEDSLIH